MPPETPPSYSERSEARNIKGVLSELFSAAMRLQDLFGKAIKINGVGRVIITVVNNDIINIIISDGKAYDNWYVFSKGIVQSNLPSQFDYFEEIEQDGTVFSAIREFLLNEEAVRAGIPTIYSDILEARGHISQIIRTPDPEKKAIDEIVEDLNSRLKAIKLPENIRPFSRMSAKELHVIGVEEIVKTDKPIVVAIHGLWHGNWVFLDLIPHFASHNYEIQAVTWPGNIGSTPLAKTKDTLVVADYIESLLAFLEEVNRPCYLMGHSVGGLFCQLLAAKKPELVKGLILLASNPPSTLRYRTEADRPKRSREWSKKNLFNNESGDHIEWALDKFDESDSPYSLMDNYGCKKIGSIIDPHDIKCPIIEIEGSLDVNETALRYPPGSHKVVENLPRWDTDNHPERRRTLASFYYTYGSSPIGVTEMIEDAPHNMLYGKFAQQTAELIFQYWYILTDFPPK